MSAEEVDGSCLITTQTVAQSCPFLDDKDPVDVACQKKSKSGSAGQRRIRWTSSEPFTITFRNYNDGLPNHPFNNVSGQCDIATASTGFTCKMRKNAGTLRTEYEYAVATPGCDHDPRIYLMH